MSFRLSYEDLCGDDVLALTKLQVNRMTKAYQSGRGVTIKISNAQLPYNVKIEGGFRGAMMGIASKVLPFLGKTLLTGLIGGIGQATGNIVTNKVVVNRLYLKKCSSVFQIQTDKRNVLFFPKSGKGLGRVGSGLHLKQGNGIYEGSGLLLRPNSPLKTIAVLGWLL